MNMGTVISASNARLRSNHCSASDISIAERAMIFRRNSKEENCNVGFALND